MPAAPPESLTPDEVHRMIEQIQQQPIDTAVPSHVATARVNRERLRYPSLTLVIAALLRSAQSERVVLDQVAPFVAECFPEGSSRRREAFREVSFRLEQIREETKQREAALPLPGQLSFLL